MDQLPRARTSGVPLSHLGLAVLLEKVLGDVRREYVVEQLVCVPELIDIIFYC